MASARIIRQGETSVDAMREKATYVMERMEACLKRLRGNWGMITTIDIYTVYSLESLIEKVVLQKLSIAKRHGIRWYHARPPIVKVEYEMDMRGVRQEIML